MIQLRMMSKEAIEQGNLPGPSAVLLMADSAEQLAKVKDGANCLDVLKLVFNDSTVDCGLVRKPTADDARAIVNFYGYAASSYRSDVVPSYFVAQCEAGVGRSAAVVAALLQLRGEEKESRLIRRVGTYNRLLYRLILEAGRQSVKPDPLVSFVVRIKYPVDRLMALLLSLERQRHDSIEVVAVTDGPMTVVETGFRKIQLEVIKTPEPRGRWGHPYRQLGIDAARGEWIGLTNDDNYYVPGYVEQMLGAAQDADADLVLCKCLHAYSGWQVVPEGQDLGAWLARRELVKSTPWEGDDFTADKRYLLRLLDKARNVAVVNRPLLVKN